MPGITTQYINICVIPIVDRNLVFIKKFTLYVNIYFHIFLLLIIIQLLPRNNAFFLKLIYFRWHFRIII